MEAPATAVARPEGAPAPAATDQTPSPRPAGAGGTGWWLRRVGAGVARWWRLRVARLAHPTVIFGPGCDVRPGLHLTTTAGRGDVRFGPGCILDRGLTVECGSHGRLTVGERTIFGHRCTLGVAGEVVIGADCLIAEMVSIRDHDHAFDRADLPIREQGATVAPVQIGRDVWLGGKVTVLKGVTIGDGAVVGANSVVTRDIPPGAIAVGAPARVLRFRAGYLPASSSAGVPPAARNEGGPCGGSTPAPEGEARWA